MAGKKVVASFEELHGLVDSAADDYNEQEKEVARLRLGVVALEDRATHKLSIALTHGVLLALEAYAAERTHAVMKYRGTR